MRADAGPTVGAGHVLRCLALAQGHLSRGGHVRLRTSLAEGTPLARRFIAAGASLETVTETPGSRADCRATLGCLERLGCDRVVVDGYHFDSGFQSALCDAHSVLWIDDMAHAPPYRARWILNQNLHAQAQLYGDRHDDCTLLLGPRFALLRQEFLRWRHHVRTTPSHGRRILVTLGGGDADNLTGMVVSGLRQLRREGLILEAKVVIGGLNPHRQTLAAQLDNDAGFELLYDVDDMAPLMAWADLAVTAAGSTAWELAMMGLPALVGVLADNQVEVAEQLDHRGTARYLGWYRDLTPERIADAVADWMHDAALRSAAAHAGRRLVDGRGVERVLDTMFGPVADNGACE